MSDEEKEIKRLGLERYNIVCSECGKIANIYTGTGIGFSYMKPNAMLPSTKNTCMDCYNKLMKEKRGEE